MASWIQQNWMKLTFWHLFLLPISCFYWLTICVRKWCYKAGLLKTYQLPVPVIVVGNINVGGTGKTPLVIWLVEQLRKSGYSPGVISRGYGGNEHVISEVGISADPSAVGDEPVLIAMRSLCPVFVGVNRIEAGRALLKAYPDCDVVISDDGLQHYALQRDIEIAVIDGAKGFGNGFLLPAGPLRELRSRLTKVDAVVCNGVLSLDNSQGLPDAVQMELASSAFYNLLNNQMQCYAAAFQDTSVVAVAGIGNPERFFNQLERMGLRFERRAYPDHYAFQASDFAEFNENIVIMTEKDAVKCKSFASPNLWVLPVSAMVSKDLLMIVLNKFKRLGK